ncbi:MAG TPA: alanine racemase, partial [Planctomicrobium sp.]|nr:alanine racemase [Planctomicrobium sp.]
MPLGRHWSELETPALCLDLNLFDARLQHVVDEWKENLQNWWATGSELEIPSLAQRVASFGAFGLSHDNVSPAIAASRQVSLPSRLSQIPVHPDQLRRLCEIPACLLPCDHYAQAEQYSDWGIRTGHRFPVLIEVNLGLDQTGVRPGSDARHLALGLKTLAGIRVVGVTGNVGTIPASPDLRWLNSRVRLLTDLLPEIDQQPSEQLRVHVVAGGAVELLRDWSDVTDVYTPGLLTAEWPYGTRSPLKLASSVISRSRLERAVLDVGR